MNKNEFRTRFSNASYKMDIPKKAQIISDSIDPNFIETAGTRNLIIAMEECSELMQQLILAQSGVSDRMAIIEELADVELGLDYVKILCDLEDHKPISSIIDETNIEKFNDVSAYDNPIYALGELQIQVSKYIRGKSDQNKLLSAVKNVYMAIGRIMLIYNISMNELNRAMNVKLDRLAIYKSMNADNPYYK